MNDSIDFQRLGSALDHVTRALLSEMGPKGYWEGELSSSALSTAVAVIAVELMGERELVQPGLRWLADHANSDGGWGDTVLSLSNLSTTALVWAAFGATKQDKEFASVVSKAEQWLWARVGSRSQLPGAIVDRYGKDRTFSIPILMTLALSGRLESEGWRTVLPLPFELAALPQSWFGAMQLPVVSYALPALIAIGQAIHCHAPSKNPLTRFIRECMKESTLRKLETLQPRNGGFLEATPLTAFVTMSLASMGRREHPVARRGLSFLKASVRQDGSWPIDTNLATWVTTLAVKALSCQSEVLSQVQKKIVRDWVLAQQYQTMHPYTGSAPGGWAWTDLPGGVPDADDTAGALLALKHLGKPDSTTLNSVENGVAWLLDLQNRDGGMPTFCRGWGTLPFDRSSPELTIHAMQAWICWRDSVSSPLQRRIHKALPSAMRFLSQSQRIDGSWIPLWFGNEYCPDQENRVYGTSRILIGLNDLRFEGLEIPQIMIDRGAGLLRATQLPEGGWGGGIGGRESIEETALATEALNDLRGTKRLMEQVESGGFRAAAIGLYFARLWYFEKLYPLLFATSALGRMVAKKVI